jgi:hypothetical protein
MVTKAMVQAQFETACAAFPDNVVMVRHIEGGNVYPMLRGSVSATEGLTLGLAQTGASGLLRVNTAKLKQPWPKSGDMIELMERGQSMEEKRQVTETRPDQTGATLRLLYGGRYG